MKDSTVFVCVCVTFDYSLVGFGGGWFYFGGLFCWVFVLEKELKVGWAGKETGSGSTLEEEECDKKYI